MPVSTLINFAEPRQHTERWPGIRSSGIGGLDAAVLAGVSSYDTEWTLYHRKLGSLPRKPETEFMRMGRRLEPLMIEDHAAAHPFRDVHTPNRVYVHDLYDELVAAPDAITVPEGVPIDLDRPWSPVAEGLEFKLPGSPRAREDWSDVDQEAPAAYLVQAMWYAGLLGYDTWRIIAVMPACGWRTVEVAVERDPELVEMLMARGREFWQRVLDRNEPSMGGNAKVEAEVLGQLGRAGEPERESLNEATVVLSADAEAAVARRAQIKAELKALEDELTVTENVIKAELLYAGVGLSAVGVPLITWTQNRPSREIDVKTMRKEHPGVYRFLDARHGRTRPGARQLRIPSKRSETT